MAVRVSEVFNESIETEKLVAIMVEENKALKITRHHIETIFSQMNSSISDVISICMNNLEFSVKLFERILLNETLASFTDQIYKPLRQKGLAKADPNDAQLLPLCDAILLLKKLLRGDPEYIRNTWKWQIDALENCSIDEFCNIIKRATHIALNDAIGKVHSSMTSLKDASGPKNKVS